MSDQDQSNFSNFENIVAKLRSPDGCPWDRKQTHSTLKTYLIEEAYETIQALDEEDSKKLCEELGDLLLQIVLHAQIARELGEFNMSDVIEGISTKLINRHPHVFGESTARNAEEVALEWEAIKQDERNPGDSLLSSVPKSMPALSYSHSIQRRAASIGFDWKDSAGVLDKLSEEIKELEQANTPQQKLHEFGDILFSLVNTARWQDINLEEALRLANDRFYQRFRYMESKCHKKGISLRELSFEEQNALWDEAKEKLQKTT